MAKKKYNWMHDDWRIGDLDSCVDEDGFLYSVPVYQIRKVVGINE